MKKLLFVFSIILLSLTNHLFGQGFYTMARYVDSVYANDNSEDGPKNNIERMRKRWDGQFDQNGSFTTAAQNYYSFTQNYANSKIQTSGCSSYSPTWKEIGPSMKNNNTNGLIGAGQINRLTFHPNYDGVINKTIYGISFYGGIWKTDDDGDNWTRLKTDTYIPFSSIGNLVIDPINPARMYVTTGMACGAADLNYITLQRDYPNYTLGIYGTDDGGITWTKMNNGINSTLFNGGSIYNLQMDPLNHDNLIFSSTDGVYYTNNAAGSLTSITWNKDAQFSTLSNNDNQIVGLTYNPTSNEWFVSGLDIYSCSNPFATIHTWQSITGPTTGLDLTGQLYQGTTDQIKRINIVNSLLPGQTNDVYALIFAGADKIGVAKKTGSANWQIINYYTALSVSQYGRPIDKMAIIAGTNTNDFFIGNTSYYFIDGSTNLVSSDYPLNYSLHADMHAFYIHPTQPNKLWVVSDGGVTLKLLNTGGFNGGAVYKNNGIQSQLLWGFDDSEQDKDYELAALQDNKIQYTGGAAGTDWKMVASFDGDGYGAQIFDKDPLDAIYIGNSGNPFKRFNYLTSSSSIFQHMDVLPIFLTLNHLHYHPTKFLLVIL